jgi:hypothetical protein
MPWDSQPPRQAEQMRPDVYRPPAPRAPQPPPPRPPAAAPRVPVVASNPQGERVQIDIGAQLRQAIQEAVNESLVANRQNLVDNGQRVIKRLVSDEVGEVADEVDDVADDVAELKAEVRANRARIDANADNIEEAFSAGPHTTRVFFSGLAIDVGFALVATLSTVLTPNFNATDKEAWLLTGAMMLKTGLSTAISYVLRLKVR